MSANFESLAKTLSHEIGHSLGASHTEHTSCQSGHYLMSTVADPSNPVTTLSKCTKKTIDNFLNKDLVDQVVRNITQKNTKRAKKRFLSKVPNKTYHDSRLAYCFQRKLLKEKSSNGNLKIVNPFEQIKSNDETSSTSKSGSTVTDHGNDIGAIIAVISCLAALLLILAIALIYDWKTKKRCFQCKKRNDQTILISKKEGIENASFDFS